MKIFWKRFYTLGGFYTWVAIAGVAIAAGGAIYAGSQQKKAAAKYQQQIGQTETVDKGDLTSYKTVDWKKTVNDLLGLFGSTRKQRNAEAAAANTFNLSEAKRMYTGIQPFFERLQSQIGSNALSYSKGELPPDVVANIGRAASQRGIQGGFGYGATGARAGTALGNLNLRNLGLTSLDLSKYGTELGMRVNESAKSLSPALFDPASLIVTPGQALQTDMFNVNQENEFAKVLNDTLTGNVSTRNSVNQLQADSALASAQQQAQMIQSITSMIGGQVAGGIGGGIGAGAGSAGRYQTNSAGVPNAGTVPGYQYSPTSGYTRLA